MTLDLINSIAIIIVSVIILVCSIGILLSSMFQRKQKRKYDECLNIVKEKGHMTFEVTDGLTQEQLNKIDSEVDYNLLMTQLYNTYLNLENKIKSFDSNLDDVLTGDLKDFYINKIENFKEKGFSDVTDGIDLVGYTIVEYDKKKLKFRLTINCFCYKTISNKIVSGSNLEKIKQIMLLTYEKKNGNWLISKYEKIYEEKLSK